MQNEPPLLDIRELHVAFRDGNSLIQAVDGVSLALDQGKTVGIVGRSGSGKSTLARTVMQLVRPTKGKILFQGTDISTLSPKSLRKLRQKMQMVFQDPGGSLNEFMRVGDIISEPLLVHKIAKGKELTKSAAKLLLQVGLREEDANRFPHEFSGGQKQRIAIARAIALQPELLVCDEPTSALDVSVQAKILNLLADLRDELSLTILFITHDIAVVNHICDDVVVMNDGKIVERGSVDEVIHNPKHTVTKELMKSCQPWKRSSSPSRIS